MSYFKELTSVNKGNIKPVYLLSGTEYYFINGFIEQVKKKMSISDEDSFVYDLIEVPVTDAIIDAETLPFFSDNKLIIIYHPVFLQAKPDKTAVDHDLTVLENYLDKPAPYSTVIFVAPYEKLDQRKKITKKLKKTAVQVDCNTKKGREFHEVLDKMAKEQHIVIENDARSLIESEFEDNLYMLQKELEKLANFVGDQGTVTKDIAEKIISPSNTFNALQFVDAVIKRDLSQAIRIYKELEKMKEEPIGLIALLAYQFRIIFQVKLLQERGSSMDRMKAELKVHPYVIQLARERSKYFSKGQLAEFIELLTNTDENIKGGKMDKGIAFEMLLYQLTKGIRHK